MSQIMCSNTANAVSVRYELQSEIVVVGKGETVCLPNCMLFWKNKLKLK